jgi:creatinine amidohydrolase
VSGIYEDVIRSILRTGFDHILFLAMHMPNEPMLEQVAYKVREESKVLIAWINPLRLAYLFMRDVSPNYDAARAHGADPSLSIGKYLEPDMIDLSRIVPNQFTREFQGVPFEGGSTLSFQNFPLSMPIKLQDMSPTTGGFGDPQFATEAQGELIFNRMVEHLSALVERFSQIRTRV